MSRHPLAVRVCALRDLLRHRLHADFEEIHRLLDELEAEINAELGGCTCRHRHPRPVHIRVTDSQKGTTMGSYAIGTTVDLTAVVQNDRGQNIPDTVTWTATDGTVAPGPNGTDPNGGVVMIAVLTGITSPGDVAVTATTSDGLPFTDTITFTDPNASVPASIVVTDSAAPTA